ncbi:MAG TPA: radical SAM protein [Clostridia bacterium]|nr:radical SAM protein [Clostridia bacterium]
MKCNLCPNLCNVDRDIKSGLCHADNDMRISRIGKHFYEEPPISGNKGSGTIFFSGCTLDCEFCQNYEISKSKVGKVYTPYELAKAIKELENEGVHNINFVTPTHFSHKIRETLDIYPPNIPIVYNTSGYENVQIIKEMNAYVDIYLPDFKYADNSLALKYSKRKDYLKYCMEAISEMVKAKPIIMENGIMRQGVIVRHLVLPNNLENSKEVIRLFAENFNGYAILSIMSQFTPCYKSTILRTLKPIEYKIILSHLEKHQISDGYIQDLSSANTKFIPDFEI